MSLSELSNEDLLEQYTDMVRWWHYDPMGAKRPSEFDVDDLGSEMRRRLAGVSAAMEAPTEED
jgi:hypothetical protein